MVPFKNTPPRKLYTSNDVHWRIQEQQSFQPAIDQIKNVWRDFDWKNVNKTLTGFLKLQLYGDLLNGLVIKDVNNHGGGVAKR